MIDIVPREQTQAKLDRRAAAASRHVPAQTYTVADRMEEQAARQGERPFLYYGDDVLSYDAANRAMNRVARAADALGLRCGDTVALSMDNRPAFILVWFGLSKRGIRVAKLNTNATGPALLHALRETGARAVVAGDEVLGNFTPALMSEAGLPLWRWPNPELPAVEGDDTLWRACGNAGEDNPPADWRAGVVGESTFVYVFTSGTTGLPKAALTSHMRWMSAGDGMSALMEVGPEDVFYCCLPLYHGAAGMSLTSTALCVGGSIVLRRKFSRREFWSDVRRYRVTVCQYIGEICRYLLNEPPRPDDRDHTLRRMIGAGLNADVWNRFVERFGVEHIFEGWGSTEANTGITNVDNYPGSCGRIPFWDKTNVRLVRYDTDTDTYPRDANGFLIPCQPGEVGEAIAMILHLPDTGAGRFEGYTSADATEKKILRNAFQPGDAWWRSGDLLRYDENGYVFFVDRIGDTFRWKSENVSTQEVAEALGDFPGVDVINIYGVRVPGHEGRAGMAAVVMQEGQAFDPAAFFRLTGERLPGYAAPLFVRVSPQADMTATFKLRKVDLQRQGYDPARVREPLYLRDDSRQTYIPYSEEALARLGLPPFRADED